MAKKGAQKESSKGKLIKTPNEVRVEKVLVENFVALQKVMTTLSINFDNLSNKISKLLELFELSAKTITEKEYDLGKDKKDSEKIMKKIDGIYEQNKIIAKGLTLLHEPAQEIEEAPSPIISTQSMPPAIQGEPGTIDINQYQRSISSQNPSGPVFKRLPRV